MLRMVSMTDTSKKKLTILGTGTSQGIPVIGCDCGVCTSDSPKDKRLRCSVKIETDNTCIIIDTGPDFRTQMLASQTRKIDAVLLTHEHNDHIIGLDDVRPFNFRQGKMINVYALRRVINEVNHRFQYIFSDKPYPGSPRIMTHIIEEGAIIELGDLKVEALSVLHGRLPILGYRIDKLAYLTDVKVLPEATLARLKNLDVLLLSALHHYPHHSHLTLQEAVDMAQLIGAEETYLIHMSHYMGLHGEVSKTLPENIHLAYDMQEIFF